MNQEIEKQVTVEADVVTAQWQTPEAEEIVLSCEVAAYMNAELPEEA